MIRMHDFKGNILLIPETEKERIAMQPEAKLRELFAGDNAGMQRFHDRLRDLDQRFDAWEEADIRNWSKAFNWRCDVRWGVEVRS